VAGHVGAAVNVEMLPQHPVHGVIGVGPHRRAARGADQLVGDVAILDLGPGEKYI
jgi:hypothetical protein